MNVKKVSMLKLRQRTINRLKVPKQSVRMTPKTKVITKKSISVLRLKSGKKCLRIFDISGQTAAPVVAQKPSSPIKSVSVKPASPQRIGARTMAALVGHRRICLRNRRLMGSPRGVAISAF